MAEDEAKVRRIFKHYDQDQSGYIDSAELRSIFDKLAVKLDNENMTVLLKRYDEDGNGKLNEDEFCELMLIVSNLKAQFQRADSDKSGSISVPEMATVVKNLNLKVSADMIRPIMQLFDEDGSGTVDYQEFFALIFYFQELEYQYENFKDKVVDYSWVAPLLGPENLSRVPVVAQQLQKMKAQKPFPSFDEFVKLILQEAVAANCDPTGRKKRNNAPRITVVRDRQRMKAPKRTGVKIGSHKHNDRVKSTHADSFNSDGGKFMDPNFAPSPNYLPAVAKTKIFDWKRPREINAKAELFVEGVDEGDVLQGGLGDCWFLGALAVVATSSDDFVEHLFVEKNPETGYYKCKFYKNGYWQMVSVDDRLPCSHSGKLFFATCRDPTEFWVPIVEKAYAKLHGSYEALEYGNIADGLKDLTGEAVEVVMLDDKSYNLVPDQLWNTLVYNIKESYLMGCAIEQSGTVPEHALPTGLLVNHAYSIIHCEEVKGVRLMRIRNPWGRGEWTGPWGDGTKEWTPQLMKYFNYTFDNDGTFFMKYEDFLKNFNRIYVLRLMTDSEGEVWQKYDFHGEWIGESAGGCTNNPSWHKNPQYALTIKKPNTKVFINLSQPDLRYVLKTNPGNYKRQYDPVGIVIFKTSEPDYKKTSFTQAEKVATSLFCGMRDISLEFMGQPGHYIILPCTFTAAIEMQYELVVYTQYAAAISEVKMQKPKNGLPGAWQGRSCGGCVNYQATWMNNPQYILTCESSGTVEITLEQQLTPQQEPECIGVYVFKANGQQRLDRPTQLLVIPNTFDNLVSVTENLKVEARSTYIIMPTTFDPVERKYQISVSSADARVSVFAPLQ